MGVFSIFVHLQATHLLKNRLPYFPAGPPLYPNLATIYSERDPVDIGNFLHYFFEQEMQKFETHAF